jgi:hypothetical protein
MSTKGFSIYQLGDFLEASRLLRWDLAIHLLLPSFLAADFESWPY